MLSIRIKTLFFITFFLSISISVNAQKERLNIDSLYNAIQVLPNTEKKVDDLLDLHLKTKYFTRPDILEKALDIAKEIYYIDGIAIAYDRKGYIERKKNNFIKSIEFHKRALGFFEKSKDTLAKMKCLNNIAVSFRKINSEQEAYKYYARALDLAKKTKNEKQIARIFNGIGNVFVNTEEYDKALFYFKKSLSIEKKYKKLKGQEYDLANIGEVFIYKKQYDSAQVYLNKALDIAKNIYKKDKLGVEYNLLGLLYLNKGDYQKAIENYNIALPMLTKYNIMRYTANTYINLGLSELHLGKKTKAFQHIREGLDIAKKINSKENISLGYDALVTYYETLGDYKDALSAHILSTKYHDSIVNVTSKNSIITAQIIYETREKDEQIKKLAFEKEQEQKNSRKNLLILIGTIIVSTLIMVFLYMFFSLKRKNSDLEIAQKNSEIQNYIMRIKELKELKTKEDDKARKDISKKLENLDLTKREQKVLELIADGYSNEQIAELMYISKNTVKSHIKNIYLKLDVKNRIQVIQKIRNA